MASSTQAFIDLNFEVKHLSWRSLFNAWHQRRINTRNGARNLARLSARDLRDLGINPAQFQFDLNHGTTENQS